MSETQQRLIQQFYGDQGDDERFTAADWEAIRKHTPRAIRLLMQPPPRSKNAPADDGGETHDR